MKYVIQWESRVTGKTGQGTAEYSLSEAEKVCRESDKKFGGYFKHEPVPAGNGETNDA